MKTIEQRIAELDWGLLKHSLDENGYVVTPRLLQAEECGELMKLYADDNCFRKRIEMARYRFGEGEYKYFAAPLPHLIAILRTEFYQPLASIANDWAEKLGTSSTYPQYLDQFLDHCHRQGQTKPTPLMLQYGAGGYNCLHQDLYGEVSFPFQVVFVLNQQNIDFTGGEFLLMEQRPRAQSRGHVITLEAGQGLIFPTRHRPVAGARGFYKVALRHGVSTIRSGVRYSLGVIFHDAT